MFSEFLEFDETRRQTQGIIPAIILIYQNTVNYKTKKWDKSIFLDLSQDVTPQGLEPWTY